MNMVLFIIFVLLICIEIGIGFDPETLEGSRFLKDSELYQVHYSENFGKLPAKTFMLHGYQEYTGSNVRIQKIPKGWLVTWVHWNTAQDMYYLYIDAFNQDWKRVGFGPPKALCSSKQLSSRYTACSPYDSDGMHIFYQLGDQIRHQTVLWPGDDLLIAGGWCGDSNLDSFDNVTHVEVTPRTFDVLMHASCGYNNRTALVYKVSKADQHLAVLLHKSGDDYPEGSTSILTIESPASLHSYPKVYETGEGLFIVVWEGDTNAVIYGQVFSENGILLGDRFSVTVGMSHSFYSFPEVVPDRYGAGFVVIWKETPYDVGHQAPRSIIWMREFESDGTPADDNPDPHVVFSSYYTSAGMKPVGTTTLDGMIWISFINENKLQGGLFDFAGYLYETWETDFATDLGFKNVTELTQEPFGELNSGLAIAASGGPTKPISVYYIDRYSVRGTPDELSELSSYYSLIDYRDYWRDRDPNYTSWHGNLPHEPNQNWNPTIHDQ